MTPSEIYMRQAAINLDKREYGDEEPYKGFFDEMKQQGLVIVFGASDDLMEFRGAINDEVGCYNGGTAYLNNKGLLTNECEDDDCPHFKRMKEGAATIKAHWSEEGFSFTYSTTIPHATFIIMEGESKYCRGIVFDLNAVPA